MTITAFADAVGTQLGRIVLLGHTHVNSNVNWPKLVCVPLEGEVNDSLETGGRINGDEYTHLIGLRQIMCDWHIWEENFVTAEATANAVYIAIHRVATAQDSQTSIVGERWLNEQQSAITAGGSYIVIRASIGLRLIDTNQVPLLTLTTVSSTGTFGANGEVVCAPVSAGLGAYNSGFNTGFDNG